MSRAETQQARDIAYVHCKARVRQRMDGLDARACADGEKVG